MTKKKTEWNREVLNVPIKKFIEWYIYRIDLDADYQREKIWSLKQQQLLLNSILKEIDIPKIYLVKANNKEQFDYECIDGKQRMTTLLNFYKSDSKSDNALKVKHYAREFTYQEFREKHPVDAKRMDEYPLSIVIYNKLNEEEVREIFRRLQLGVRLNSGELLNSRSGTIRDFIYKENRDRPPFFRHTRLSDKRFSIPFTLAQICINSFARFERDGEFVRARLIDLEEFFDNKQDIDSDDVNLERIRNVLKYMDKAFMKLADMISSRAVAVSAYLFVEELYSNNKRSSIDEFAKFYKKLLKNIKDNMRLLNSYKKPRNIKIMDEFQKYILQASVEPYSIKRRHEFLKEAFDCYMKSKPKGKIIGS